MLTETRLYSLLILQSSLQTTQRQEHCRMFCQMREDTQTGMLQNWEHLIIPYTPPSAQSPILVKVQLKLWNSQLLYSQICLAWLQLGKELSLFKKTKQKKIISHYPKWAPPSLLNMKLNVNQNYSNSTCLYLIYTLPLTLPPQFHPVVWNPYKLLYFVDLPVCFVLCLCLFDFWVRFLLSFASLEHTTYKAQVGLHFWQPSCLSAF